MTDSIPEAPEPSAWELKSIGALVLQKDLLEARIALLVAQIEEKAALLKVLVEKTLPEAMDAANCSEFKTRSGAKLVIASIVAASIPKDRETEAFAWLREHGQGDLIKHSISTSFGKGEEKAAAKVIAALKKQKVDFKDKESVHPQTLSAFCREQIAEGIELPADTLGLYHARVAKVEQPKKGKA